MEINKKIYIKKADGSNFHDVYIKEISVTDNVMGDSFASGNFLYKDTSLVTEINNSLYIEYRGKFYYISEQPTITQNNKDVSGLCRYDVKLSDIRDRLKNIPFTDEPLPSTSEFNFRNGSRTVQFYGNLTEFVDRLNASLKVNAPSSDPNKQWQVVFQAGYEDVSEPEEVNLTNSFMTDALSSMYDLFKVPYVFDGYKIYVGKPVNIIDYTFKFGQGVGLRNNDRTSKKNKIVTRIAGYGSTTNIPDGYPIVRKPDGTVVKHIYTRPYLMPTVWVEAVNRKVLNGSSEPLIDYYDAIGSDYVNQINPASPSYHVQQFEKAYPTIIGATHNGKKIDEIFFVPPTNNYDDSYDEETGEYKYPHFELSFYPLGFDIYAQAAVTGEMTLSMKSGDTRGANFKFAVDEALFNKSFYVNGVFTPNSPNRDYEKFPDSTNKSITIKFFKDSETFGRLYPNQYQKPKVGDTFVILDIEMPQKYIDEAQYRLDDMMKEFMKENNIHKYEYPLSFSEHFLHTHESILNSINTNTLISFEYNKKVLSLPIQSITIIEGKNALPSYDIKLTDEISVVFGAVGQLSKNVEDLRSIVSRGDVNIPLLKTLFHPLKGTPTTPFQASEMRIFGDTFFGAFSEGAFGSGAALLVDPQTGRSRMEVDELYVRLRAIFTETVIDKMSHVGGQLVSSPARMACIRVEETTNTYKCYFDSESDQEFVPFDQAQCRVFTGAGAKFYWRLVTAIGDDYIELSKTDAAVGSSIPEAGDNIFQIGNRNLKERQNVQILSSYGDDAPSFKQYTGINSYSMEGKEINVWSAKGNKSVGDFVFGNGKNVSDAIDDAAAEGVAAAAEAQKRLNEWAKDNVISPTEKQGIKDEIVKIDADKNDIVAGYTRYSLGTPSGYNSAYTAYRAQLVTLSASTPENITIPANFATNQMAYYTQRTGSLGIIQAASKKLSDDAQTTASDAKNYIDTVLPTDLEKLQAQIDGVIESFFKEYDPSLTNAPANSWTTDAEKERHANDTFTNTLTGKSWKWVKVGSTWQWNIITDTATEKALALAAKAQDTADGKRRVFVAIPTKAQAYDIGDLWTNATYGSYKDDLLRCKTAKVANADFNIAHWELASKYTDDTRANEALAAAAEADSAAALASTAAAEAKKNVVDLNKYVDGAFKDGVITEAEAISIEKYINSVNASKNEINSTYTKLYANVYLEGVAKTNLATAKITVDKTITDLLASINTAINDGQTTVEEKADVDAKFALFTTANNTFISAVESANEAIQKKLKSYSDAAAAAALEAQNTANAAKDAIIDTNKTISDLNDYVDGAFKDGIITATEAQTIAGYINTINNNKLNLDNQYTKLYANIYLEGVAKTNLQTSKNAFNTATTNLLYSINTAIEDGVTTVEEKKDVDAKFALYNTANATLATRIEEANKSIQDKLKSFSEAAAAEAAAAAAVAAAAKTSADEANSLLSDIANDNKLTANEKQQTKKEWDVIVSEKPLNNASAVKYGLPTTNYDAAYNALNTYITPLLASLTITSTIVGSDFRTKFKTYYDERTKLLNAISDKAKVLADAAQAKADAAAAAAAAAKKAADDAQSSADNANSLLADIANDNKLTATEKQETKKEWDIISSEKPKNHDKAASYGVSTTVYDNAYSSLSTYITPLLASLTTTSNITGTVFRNTFKAYYDARTDLLNAIYDAVKRESDLYTDNKIANIEVGGRNLLPNSDFSKPLAGKWANSADGNYKLTLNNGQLKVVGTVAKTGSELNASWNVAWYVYPYDFNETAEYTLSFNAYSLVACTLFFRPNFGGVTANGGSANVTTTMSEYKITFKNLINDGTRLLGFVFDQATTLFIDNMKLEKGNVGTGWTPAIEDIQSDINAAQQVADNAQSSANTANNAIADIASDNKLAPVEKSSERSRWNDVAAEKSGINTQATKYSLTSENTAYNNAFQALANYLNGGTTWSTGIPLWLSDAQLSVTTTIVGSTYRSKWESYFTARQNLLNAIYSKAKEIGDNAQSTADAAKRRLDQWASDGIISPTEKQSLKDEIARIDADKNEITNGYTKYSLGTPTAYNTAHANYRAVLVTLSASTPENINIPSDFATKQSAYYNQRTQGLNVIATAAKKIADDAQSSIDNLQIGGRNLFLNSKRTLSGTTYNVGVWTSTRDFVVGEELTATIKGNITGTKLFGLWFNSSTIASKQLVKVENGLYSATFKVPTGTNTKSVGIYLAGNQTAGDSWSFEWVKLETGNKRTDWTPAPEELEQGIADATQMLADISNDNLVTPSEKQELLKEWKTIKSEYPINVSQASVFAVSSAAYTTAYNSLNSFIGTNLDNLTTTWSVSGATLRTRFDAYYTEKTKLLNAFVAIARNNADDAKAKTDNFTLISGGLILTSIQKLGEWVNGTFKVQAGISGIGSAASDIMAWFGGDRLETGATKASVVFRRDGSGYLAKNNIWWDAAGNLSSTFNTIFIGETDIKVFLNTVQSQITTVSNKLDDYFQKVNVGTSAAPVYAIKVRYNLYSDQDISAGGYMGGGGGSSDIFLSGLADVTIASPKLNDVLQYNGSKWVNRPFIGGVDMSSVWSALGANTSEQINVSHLTGVVKKVGDTMSGALIVNTDKIENRIGNGSFYSKNTSASSGGWARGLVFLSSAGNSIGSFGAYATGDTLNTLYVGTALETANSWQLWNQYYSRINVKLEVYDKVLIAVNSYDNQLEIKRVEADGNSVIRYSNGSGTLGTIGIYGNAGLYPEDLLFYNKAGVGNRVWHSGNDGSGSGLDADLLDGFQRTRYGGGISTIALGTSGKEYTYREFIAAGTDMNFATYGRRGTWDYANNGYITTNFGNLGLAGLSSLSFGTSGNSTTLFITANTSSGTPTAMLGEMLFHIDNGDTYVPTWRRVLTNYNYNSYALPLTGGTINGNLKIDSSAVEYPLIVNSDSATQTYIRIHSKDINKSAFGWYNNSYGTFMFNYASAKYLGISDAGIPHFHGSTLLYAGNYSSFALPIGGGILTGKLTIQSVAYRDQLAIWRQADSSNVFIDFYNGTTKTMLGSFGFLVADTPIFSTAAGGNYYLLHTGNYNAYAPSLNGIGANGTWGINITGKSDSTNRVLINNTEVKNEARFQYLQMNASSTIMPDSGWWSLLRSQHGGYTKGYWQEIAQSFAGDVVKYRRNVNGAISEWRTFAWTDGNVDSATRLETARLIFGRMFDGSSDVAGQAFVYGTKAAAGQSYASGGIQVREAGLIGSAQTDDLYAPRIGFHWASRIGASIILNSTGFKFQKQNETDYANIYAGNVYAGLIGNASTATALNTTRTLWGQNFNGTQNVSGALNRVTSVSSSDLLVITSVNEIDLAVGTGPLGGIVFKANYFKPFDKFTNKIDLGISSGRWKGIYANTLNLTGDITVDGITTTGRIINTGGINVRIGSTDEWTNATIFSAGQYPLAMYYPGGNGNTRKYYYSGGSNSLNFNSLNDANTYVASIATYYHTGAVTWHGPATFNTTIYAAGSIRGASLTLAGSISGVTTIDASSTIYCGGTITMDGAGDSSLIGKNSTVLQGTLRFTTGNTILSTESGNIIFRPKGNASEVNQNFISPSGYLYTNMLLSNGEITGNDRRFNEALAYYDNNSQVATGTICITLPNGWNNSMNIYEIYVYEYSGVGASVITIGGYNYAANSAWYNYNHHTKGNYHKGIRVGYNGSKCVILLGTTTTNWAYPKVYLKTVLAGYSNQTLWSNGYSISLLTSESGYSSIQTSNKSEERFGKVWASEFVGSLTGNADSATKLETARTLWGQSFNGTANISGSIVNTGHVTPLTANTYNIGSLNNRYNDGYFENWCYAGKGLYLDGPAVTRVATNYLELSNAGNEMVVASTTTDLHVNYRVPGYNGRKAPATWYWRAGSSSSFADFNLGDVNANGNVSAVGYYILGTIPTVADNWTNVLQTRAGFHVSTEQSVAANSSQLVLGWQNVITSVGYRTTYRIYSWRGTSGSGSMRFAVGSNDSQTVGKFLDLNGSGEARWTGNFRADGQLKSVDNGFTSTFGAQNTNYCHIYTTAPSFYMDKGLSALTLTSRGALNTGGNISANGSLSGWSIELSSATPFIDFHFGSSTADYTSRLYESASGRLSITGKLSVNGYVNDSYGLATGGLISNTWIRTTGNYGWYSETHGGGIYMTDVTYVQVYGSKNFKINSGTFYALHIGSGSVYRAGYSGTGWGNGPGTINTIIANNSSQTPLIVASRNDAALTTGDVNRLFSMEFLNSGTELRFFFANSTKFIFNNSGDIQATRNITATGEVSAGSDIRFKSNIRDLVYRGRLNPKQFLKHGKPSMGFIAQEVQEKYSELVFEGNTPERYLTLNYGGALAVVSYQVNKVEDEVTILKRKVNELENEVKLLKSEK